jgi:hypothetical protein
MKVRHPANDNAAERARLVWERRLGRPVGDKDLRELSTNLTGFFSILAEWSRKAAPANDNTEDRSSEDESTVR